MCRTSQSNNMSEKTSIQPQPTAMYGDYPPNRVPYTNTGNPYLNSQGKYKTIYGPSQLADAVAGMNVAEQCPLSTTHGLKSSMSRPQSNIDLNNISRAGYGGNPLMVLPNGHAVPLSAFYGQQLNSISDHSAQLPYIPTGMFPNFIGGTNLLPSAASSCSWPCGVPGHVPDLDPNQRGSWSSNEGHGP